jgi:hypothetical protein
MKRLLVVFLLLMTLAGALSAQLKATITGVTGKVEIKAGDTAAWRTARVGMVITKGSFVSTGFDSTAVLEIGQSVVRVRPLTRMKLEDLVQKGGAVSTTLSLNVGRVRAEVKTVTGVSQDFKLKGPVSTAAVRGTEFEFDGFTVKVANGVVEFVNDLNQKRDVAGGEDSSTDGLLLPTTGDQEKDRRSEINPYTSPTDTNPVGGPASQMAHVTIRWQ